jgi:drug/metabolite transporter (DMT)-like permease
MVPAALTSFLFAFSGVCAGRSTRLIGAMNAGFLRLLVAFLFLSGYAYLWGQGHRGPGLVYFAVSGAIGIGIGDTAVFLALKRIGPRLSIMLTQCLAAPFGAAIEWGWLGTTLTPKQICGICTILCGSSLAIWPDKKMTIPPTALLPGVLFGVLSAFGQALGAVVTRKANALNSLAHFEINGLTAAYQRLLGALLAAFLLFALAAFLHRARNTGTAVGRDAYQQAAPWIVLNALSGLTLGVACYQWALQYTATGIVLAIVALTPLMVMPMTYFMDHDRPTKRASLGAVIAVAGVLLLMR